MEWSPGPLILGTLIFVGLVFLAVRIARRKSYRTLAPAERNELVLLTLLFATLGLMLIALGVPAGAEAGALWVTMIWGLGVFIGYVVARIRARLAARTAARAAAELGAFPGPPRFTAAWLAVLGTLFCLGAVLLVLGAIVGGLYAEAGRLPADRVSAYSGFGAAVGFCVALAASAAVGLLRFLNYQGRVKAHRALEQVLERRIADERADAYRAGVRDGKAASAVDDGFGSEL